MKSLGGGMSSDERRILSGVYGMAIGLAGWTLLLSMTAAMGDSPHSWTTIAAFIGFSMIIQRMGFHAAAELTHSLVGIVDLAAVITFGPLAGGIVAGISGGAYLMLSAIRYRRLNWMDLLALPLFNSGLKVLMALTAGYVYSQTGGTFSPRALPWSALGSFAITALVWFLLDHLGWGLREWIEGGLAGLAKFLDTVWRYSVPVELLPLPSAALIALAYSCFDTPAFILLALGLVSVGAVAQRLVRSLHDLRSRAAELRTLNEFSRELVSATLDVEEICELLHRYSSRVVDTSDSTLALLDASRGTAIVVIDVEGGQRRDGFVCPPGEGSADWVLRHGESLLIRDLHNETLPFTPIALPETARSALYIPLLAEGRPIGSFAVQSAEQGRFDEDDERILSAFANQGAAAIEKARLYARERQRARQLATVSEVSLKVAAILGLQELFGQVVNLIQESFSYYHVGIYTVDHESGDLYFKASTGCSDPEVRIDRSGGMIGWVATHGEPVLANDVGREPRFRYDTTLPETLSELTVPLKVSERVVGVLDVQSDEQGAFDEDDLFVMRTLAAQVAIAVEDARMYVERQEQAWVATALLQVAETIGSLTSSEEVLSSIVRLRPILVGVDRCLLLLWDARLGKYTSSESFGLLPESRARFANLQLAPGQFPLLDWVRAADKPILVRSGDDQRLIPIDVMRDYEIGVAMALPLRVKGEVVGVMLAEYSDPNAELSKASKSVLTGIANQAAMAVESARLYEARREEAWVSTALLQVSASLENTSDLDEILDRVVSLTTLLAGVDRCAILLFEEDTGEFVPAQAHGIARERLPEFLALRFGLGQMPLLDEIRERREPVSAERASDGASVSLQMMQEFGFSSLLGLPLLARGEVIGAMLVDRKDLPRGLSERQISVLTGIANQVSVAIENTRLYQESLERERMARELQLARDIQISFLPKECPHVPGWQIHADWRSAREVGGDFYDFIWLDTKRLGLVIADVSDKGVPAALFMALSRTVMRASATDARSPVEALMRANELLTADTSSGMFVTLFYGILDITTGHLKYARAGHNPPLHFDRTRDRVRPLDGKGIVLGIIEEVSFEERTVTLGAGDVLVLYTDGVTEAINSEEEEYGVERLTEVIRAHGESSAVEIIEGIDQGVARFSSGVPQFDDLTLVVVKREPGVRL